MIKLGIMDEIEWKWQLSSEADHQTLSEELWNQFGRPHIIPQCNRFFDTPDHTLRKLKMSVRLRRNGHQLVITAKRQRSVEQGLHRQWEWEREINNCCWQCTYSKISPNLKEVAPLPIEVRDTIGNKSLECFGGFDNERQEWHHNSLHIALDKTKFGSRTDHELEVEIPELCDDEKGQAQWWLGFAANKGVTLAAQPLTKLQRFVQLG